MQLGVGQWLSWGRFLSLYGETILHLYRAACRVLTARVLEPPDNTWQLGVMRSRLGETCVRKRMGYMGYTDRV